MTIANETNRRREDGNGVKTAFDFPFKIFSAGDIDVYKVVKSTGVATLQVINTDYTVAIDTDEEGGTVTFITAPTALQESLIIRNIDPTQSTSFPSVGSIQKRQIENALDRLTIIGQQILEKVAKSLKFSTTSSKSDIDVPEPVANQVLGWDATATVLENKALIITSGSFPGLFSAGLDASKAASPTANDVYVATDTRILYICFVTGSWTKYAADGVTLRVSQTAHGFVAGDVLRWNSTNYSKALADSEANAEVIGMVSAVPGVNEFLLTIMGLVSGLSGLTAGTQYYLSASTAGALTSTRPAGTNVVKPLLQAISTTSGFFFNQATTTPAAEDHYRQGFSVHYESGTDTIAIEAGVIGMAGSLVTKAGRSTLSIGTAGNYAGGVSLRAVNTVIWVGVDASGNIRLHTTAGTHSDFAVSVTTGKKRYVTWASTVYRILGWIRTNGTGSGEIDKYRVGNILDVNTRNRVLYEDAATPSGTNNLPIDDTIPQDSEGTAGPSAGIVIGDANSKILVKTVHSLDNISGGNGAGACSALFKDGTASAKRSRVENLGPQHSALACNMHIPLEYQEAAGAVGWQTWSLRFGQGTSTIVQNTVNNGQFGADTMLTTIELEEIDP